MGSMGCRVLQKMGAKGRGFVRSTTGMSRYCDLIITY